MTQNIHRSLSATMAIAAVLALGSTPAFAQQSDAAQPTAPVVTPEAAPSNSTPAPSGPQATAPAVQDIAPLAMPGAAPGTTAAAPAPAQTAAPANTVSTPVIETPAAPAADASTANPPPPANAAASAPVTRHAARTGPAVAPRAAVPVAATPLAASAPAPMAPVVTPVVTNAAPKPVGAPAPVQSPADDWIYALGAVVGLGLIGGAVMATRRSMRRDEIRHDEILTEYEPYTPVAVPEAAVAVAPESIVEQPAPAPIAEPVVRPTLASATPGAWPLTAPVLRRAPAEKRESLTDESLTETRPETRPADARGFIMPSGPVPAGDAREAMLEEMVAAPPDEANPFRSVKARRHRARLILQTREQDLRDKAVEPFDWRTYRASGEASKTVAPAEAERTTV